MRIDAMAARLAELVLGACCPGCGAPGLGACTGCRTVLASSRPFTVANLPGELPPVQAGGPYADRLRRVLLAAKERGALGLLPLLGSRLATALAALVLDSELVGPLVLVPVPSAPAQVAARGVDLTGSLALLAARRLRSAGLAVSVQHGLAHARRPQDQAGLDRGERMANLAGAFRPIGRRPQSQVVVVDDIVTTGATLAEAVRACRAGGREVVGAAVVAATLRNLDGRRAHSQGEPERRGRPAEPGAPSG